MDYRQLLVKYIFHVGESEGTAFLQERDRTLFSSEEWEELEKLDREGILKLRGRFECDAQS